MKKEIIVFDANEVKATPLPYSQFQDDGDFRHDLINFIGGCDYGIRDIRFNKEENIFEFAHLKYGSPGLYAWLPQDEEPFSLKLLISFFDMLYQKSSILIVIDLEYYLHPLLFHHLYITFSKNNRFYLTHKQWQLIQKLL